MAERINHSGRQDYPSVSYDLEPNKRSELLYRIATNEVPRSYPFARIIDDPNGAGYLLSIEEHAPGSVVSTYTRIRSKDAGSQGAEVDVLSKKTGLYFDSRVRKLEKQRMRELLQILETSP